MYVPFLVPTATTETAPPLKLLSTTVTPGIVLLLDFCNPLLVLGAEGGLLLDFCNLLLVLGAGGGLLQRSRCKLKYLNQS